MIGLVLVAVAGVLGVVAVIASMIMGDSPPEPAPQAGSSSPPVDGVPPASDPAPSVPTSIEPRAAPFDGLAVSAAVISPTTIEVVEVVHWPQGGPVTIELELAHDAAAAGGLAVEANPVIDALQVSVDGSPVVPTRRLGAPNSWVITTTSSAAPTSMEVRYLLEGAIVRSVPASPGRALAILTPIAVGATNGLPTMFAIAATDVLNVYCPTGTTQAAIRCGQLEDSRWTVPTLPPGPPLVVAQLDLPGVV